MSLEKEIKRGKWNHGGLLRWDQDGVAYYSVVFTWLLPIVRKTIEQGDLFCDRAIVGGPAVRLFPDYFDGIDGLTVGKSIPGMLQRHNQHATRTTTGCPNRCSFCAVPVTEGKMIELDDWPDLPIICDNNLLDASQAHFDKVCDRLERHKWCDFNQGLDARLLSDYHAERLARLPGAIVRLACDSDGVKGEWEDAYARLIRAGFPKSRMRSYVLIAFSGCRESDWRRCNFVEDHGVMALPQWYHELRTLDHNVVTRDQARLGWDNNSRTEIMRFFYKHTGQRQFA